MIRKLLEADIGTAADIWLDTNLKAHDFIPAQYWKNHFKAVKELFSQSEMYVYEDEQGIRGFVGLSGHYIEGLFVRSEAQSGGIGKQLLDYAKSIKGHLHLHVYQKNVRAIRFYQREGFEIQCASVDEAVGENEYTMTWKHPSGLLPESAGAFPKGALFERAPPSGNRPKRMKPEKPWITPLYGFTSVQPPAAARRLFRQSFVEYRQKCWSIFLRRHRTFSLKSSRKYSILV